MAVQKSMCLDGEELDGLAALFARFTFLCVNKPSSAAGDVADGCGSDEALFWVDMDGANVPIVDEASLFGAIAKLVQAGKPIQFCTMRHLDENRPSGCKLPRTEQKKRLRGAASAAMSDSEEEGVDKSRSSPMKEHPKLGPRSKYRRHEHEAAFGGQGKPSSSSASPPKSRPYVGMNVNADGLIVSKPDIFEKLLRGDKVLARVKDANGIVTTRQL